MRMPAIEHSQADASLGFEAERSNPKGLAVRS